MVFRMRRYMFSILGQYLGKSYQSDILRLIQLFHSLAEFHTDVWVDWTTLLLFPNSMNSVSPCLPRPCRLFFRRQKMHGSETKSRFDLYLEWPHIYIYIYYVWPWHCCWELINVVKDNLVLQTKTLALLNTG